MAWALQRKARELGCNSSRSERPQLSYTPSREAGETDRNETHAHQCRTECALEAANSAGYDTFDRGTRFWFNESVPTNAVTENVEF